MRRKAADRVTVVWARSRPSERVALAGLVLVLLVGVILRVLFMVAWRPAFVGYSDSGAYLYMAMKDLWGATPAPSRVCTVPE